MIPNLLPIVILSTIMVIFKMPLDMFTLLIGAIALGLAVDDTVHFLSKFRRARVELGKTTEESIRYSFHTVGPALFLTSLILVCGFLVMTFSGFRMNVQLGFMTTISIIFALFADFLFLPTLIMKLSKPITENKSHP